MSDRPELDVTPDGNTFRNYYYLKEELIDFCRKNNLPTSGGKLDITERIACFLDTGKVLKPVSKAKKVVDVGEISEDTINCWNYKKSLPGHNRYEKSDLAVLNK